MRIDCLCSFYSFSVLWRMNIPLFCVWHTMCSMILCVLLSVCKSCNVWTYKTSLLCYGFGSIYHVCVYVCVCGVCERTLVVFSPLNFTLQRDRIKKVQNPLVVTMSRSTGNHWSWFICWPDLFVGVNKDFLCELLVFFQLTA